MKAISVIGLGKLGLPMVACFASKGFTVVGVDLDPKKVTAANTGHSTNYEPGLKERLKACSGHLTATQDTEAAVTSTDATFIVVPTPTDDNGSFSTKYVISAAQDIGQAIKKKQGFHLVVLTSTVMPGATSQELCKALEEASGKICGKDFGLCYSPEFIALGSVIRDFLNPDLLLIGESDKQSGNLLAEIYEKTCENNPPVAKMNFVNAEIAKIAVNTFVTTKITFANMLARICEKMPEAAVDVVTNALGLDSRIGNKYLKGAIGYGGPCFPRDNVALSTLGQRLGAQVLIAEATDRANKLEINRLADLALSYLPPKGTIGILGISYKPDTDVTEQSQGLLLAQNLGQRGISNIIYDPAAMKNASTSLGDTSQYALSTKECTDISDVLIITTPWPEFKNIPKLLDRHNREPKTVIDCWRILSRKESEGLFQLISLGEYHENPKRNN